MGTTSGQGADASDDALPVTEHDQVTVLGAAEWVALPGTNVEVLHQPYGEPGSGTSVALHYRRARGGPGVGRDAVVPVAHDELAAWSRRVTVLEEALRLVGNIAGADEARGVAGELALRACWRKP